MTKGLEEETLHLSPAESGDLYKIERELMEQSEKLVTGVITSGGRPIKIHVRRKAKSRYKRHRTGRKTPYGTQTRHHYLVLECPDCGGVVVSLYRVRHTYKSLHIWLRKAFNIKRFFRFPLPNQEWAENKKQRYGLLIQQAEVKK